MRSIVIAVITVTLLSGCNGEKPIPTSRLVQPAGQFSFITPDGWFRTKLPVVDFIIVSTEPDYGAVPTIFVDFVTESTNLGKVTVKLIDTNTNNYRKYEVKQQSAFVTEFGLSGIKVSAGRENNDALPLALYHYLIQDADRVIVITCASSYPVRKKYEPIFDAAMKSLRSEVQTN